MRSLVLLSAGRAGPTGRPRRAACDARAVEVGLRLTTDLIGLHVGAEAPEALRLYGGMGLAEIRFVKTGAQDNVLPALEAVVLDLEPDLVLAGALSEQAHASGMLPFALARLLDLPLLSEISGLQRGPRGWLAEQRLGRGLVRHLETEGPVVATIGSTGPPVRYPAPGLARKAALRSLVYPHSARAWTAPEHLRAANPPMPALAGPGDMLGSQTIARPRGAAVMDAARAAALVWEEILRAGLRPPTAIKSNGENNDKD